LAAARSEKLEKKNDAKFLSTSSPVYRDSSGYRPPNDAEYALQAIRSFTEVNYKQSKLDTQ